MGATTTLRLPHSEAEKKRIMLDLQWNIMMLATLSGVVNAAEELRRKRPVYNGNDDSAVSASGGNLLYYEKEWPPFGD